MQGRQTIKSFSIRAHVYYNISTARCYRVRKCVCVLTISLCVSLSPGSMLSQAESSLPSYSSLSVFSSGVQVGHSSFIIHQHLPNFTKAGHRHRAEPVYQLLCLMGLKIVVREISMYIKILLQILKLLLQQQFLY